jgi:hypothetical protein
MERIGDWPAPAPGLERAYRRLLLAYPRSYRRRHGTELLTTVLEMAAPGQRRPTAADAWHLFRAGVRQRFRLPAGRPLAWVVAVLTLLAGGAAGAAAGSWSAAQTLTPLPSTAGVKELNLLVAPTGREHLTILDPDSSAWSPGYLSDVPADGWDPEAARRSLAAAGWALGAPHTITSTSVFTDGITGAVTTEVMTGHVFTADRDGLLIRVQGWPAAERGMTQVRLWQQDNGAVLPLSLAGAAAGLLFGWLAVAAGFRGLRRSPGPSRRAAALTTLALAAFALPATALYVNLGGLFRHDPEALALATVHRALDPSARFWTFGPLWLNAGLTAITVTLVLITLPILAPRREAIAATRPTTS